MFSQIFFNRTLTFVRLSSFNQLFKRIRPLAIAEAGFLK